MKISRTISGPRKHTSFSRGQELAKARIVVEKIFSNKDKQLIKYVLLVARLKSRGNDLFIARIKKFSDRAIAKASSSIDKRALSDKIRMINLYFYNLDPNEAQRFIEKFERY